MIRLYATAIIVLVVGLSSALVIYATADNDPIEAQSYQIVGSDAYPTDLSRSKMYLRELQRFGGKAAVLFDQFNRWFVSLWQGKSLGVSVAWISVLVSLGIFLFARYLSPHSTSGVRGEDNRDRTSS